MFKLPLLLSENNTIEMHFLEDGNENDEEKKILGHAKIIIDHLTIGAENIGLENNWLKKIQIFDDKIDYENFNGKNNFLIFEPPFYEKQKKNMKKVTQNIVEKFSYLLGFELNFIEILNCFEIFNLIESENLEPDEDNIFLLKSN